MPYVNSSTIGVDFATAQDSPGTFAAGTVVNGSQDSLWVYCETVGVFTTGVMGTISTSSTATPAAISAGQVATAGILGFAQTSSTSGQFAWFCQRGLNVYVKVSGTTNASAVLYITATSGVLHSTSASSTMGGVMMLANVSSTATTIAVLANLSWPKFLSAGM
jgi:hypothetical protein